MLAASLSGQAAPPDDVLAHLATCEGCRELHLLVTTLQHEHADALAQARIPSAGQVWWRAELRARHEAAATAARPITVVTGLAAASLLGLLASLAGVIAWWLQDWWTSSAVGGGLLATLSPAAWAEPSGLRLGVWLVAGALLVATPVLLYVALRDD